MEALSVEDIPSGPGWQYEPKWDGFRCLVFRDGKKVELQSKAGQPLSRYFPEVVESVQKLKAARCVLDGEIVIPAGDALSFDDLLLRIHPAASRVQKLAAEHPALLILFDILVDAAGKSLVKRPLKERRKALEAFARANLKGDARIRLSPAASDVKSARKWLFSAGLSLDGVIAKRTDAPYRSGDRSAMQKIKVIRTADCVVGGFRYASKGSVVGSLLLGLYDSDGKLHHVGFCSGLAASERKSLTKRLERLIHPPGFTGRAPGGPSRWSTERTSQWQPLEAKLVVEVGFDHASNGRFRHGTRLIRWRPDKAPRQCGMEQLRQKRSRSLRMLE